MRESQRRAPLRSRSTLLVMGSHRLDPSGQDRAVGGLPGETDFRKAFSHLDIGKAAPPVSDRYNLSGSRSSPEPQTLVWVRRDLVRARSFSPEDCHPARGSFLPKPTRISFAELWGAEEGRRSFVEVVKMAGGGHGAGRFSGAGGGRAPPVAAMTARSTATSLSATSDQAVVKSEFPQAMMQ
jgi:hypothetical protein